MDEIFWYKYISYVSHIQSSEALTDVQQRIWKVDKKL
jgi:hypothetical protein